MDSDQAKLFVGGISRDTSEDILKDHFGKYGTVLGSVIAKDKVTQIPRGFGFVSFSDPSLADKALKDSHVILGRTVEVKKAIPRSEQRKNQQRTSGLSKSSSNSNDSNKSQIRTRKIFVGGLSASLTEQEFKNYFERFGRITDVVVMHDSLTHKPRGFGFITFDSEDSVENVTQNSFHELNGRLLEVKKAVPKEDNSSNGRYYVRNGGGRGSPNNSYPPGNYPSCSPRYVVPPSYAPFLGYTGTGGFVYGPSVYDGWFPLGGFRGVSYGVAPMAPGYGPRMNGARACLLPYGSASFYPAYVNGEGGVISFAAGGYNGVRPGANGKWNQVVIGIGHAPADVVSYKSEGDRRDVGSVSLKGSSVAASSEQSGRGSDG